MLKYLKLYKSFIEFSISRSLEFRFDFTFRIIMDVIFYLVKILFYKVIFLHTDSLAGWNEHQVMIFIGGFFVLDAIQMTMVSNNAWMLPTFVNKGELDYYLLRPVSSLFFLSLRDFAFNSFFNLLIAVGFWIYAFASYPLNLEWWRILLYVFLIINGSYIFYCFRMIILLPVFWTHNGRGLEMIYWTLDQFAERPDQIYKGFIRKILLSILPFSVMVSLPTHILFGEGIVKITLHCLLVAVIAHILLITLWKFALKNYTSASS